MTFSANVFRVLIASPSDVSEEREVAAATIQEWNNLNANERQIVLLPVRWETHSAPEYGRRPQAIINQQLVDDCDLLLGIFWTRIGSSTGVADSGTLEEIERIANLGRPVMLYFSQARQDPERIDLEQLGKLREFKKKTLPNALVESYSSTVDFRDKLSRQLEIKVRGLVSAASSSGGSGIVPPLITDIKMAFADIETGSNIGSNIHIPTRYTRVKDVAALPNFEFPPKEENLDSAEPTGLHSSLDVVSTTDDKALSLPSLDFISILKEKPNKNYLRQLATHRILQPFFRPIRFSLKNFGGVGARDLYIELSVRSAGAPIAFIGNEQLSNSEPSKAESNYSMISAEKHPESPDVFFSKMGPSWAAQMSLPALQPQREIAPPVQFLIGAMTNSEVKIEAKIFADTLPEPTIQSVLINLDVTEIEVLAHDLVTISAR